MYKRVELSAYVLIITALMIAVMSGVIIYSLKQPAHNLASWILGAIAVLFFAYYGKAFDCFLVVLKDGRKYLLGCQDAPEMVEAICGRMQAV